MRLQRTASVSSGKLPNFARLLRTVRHLKAIQITNRVSRTFIPSKAPTDSAPALRRMPSAWTEGIRHAPKLLAPARIKLIGIEADISSREVWRDANKPKLWLYQLHYFDDLNAADNAERATWHRALLDRWLNENPPGSAIAWDPYPISLRVVNWIKWQVSGAGTLSSRNLSSLAQQVRHLLPRLEKHLLGNHLLENFKTLLFAGCFFQGAEADAWLHQGLRGLRKQVEEQILPDGAHNEMAPMYQGIIAESLLDAVNLLKCFGMEQPGWLVDAVQRMVGWGVSIAHPDGDWPSLNDTAVGIAARPGDLATYLERLDLTPKFPAAELGEAFARRSWSDWVLLADLTGLGPDHNPGHGHADSLTFELCIGGRRVVVDTGISTYEADDIRAHERSTAAHNTVEIDGQNSSEVWQSFRVGRRAHTHVLAPAPGAANSITAEHDGYRFLPGSPLHCREWQWGEGRLTVIDTIRSTGNHSLRSFIHLHPDYNPAPAANGTCTIQTGGKDIARIVMENWRQMRVIDYCYAPGYGQRIPAKCIELTAGSAGTSQFCFSIEGL
jgi:uncharacterized heparinase superfamily protein